MAYRSLPAPSTDLHRLDAETDRLLAAGVHAASTQGSYARTYGRFERWCLRQDLDPLSGHVEVVQAFCHDQIGPAAPQTVLGVFHAVSWRWQQEGLPGIPTGKNTPAKATARQLARARTLVEKKGAEGLPPSLWGRLLTVPAPDPTLDVTYARAALLVAHCTGQPLGSRGRLVDLMLDDVTVTDEEVRIVTDDSVIDLPATGGVDCPVKAVGALVAALPDRDLLFGLVVAEDGTAKVADRSDALVELGRVHRRIGKPLTALRFGAPNRRNVPVSQLASTDDLARLCWLVDLPLCRWLHAQLVLVYQAFGGFRPTTLAAARREHVTTASRLENGQVMQALAFHAHRSKGDQLARGHTRAIPSLPDHPTLCPVRLTQLWTWLLGLQGTDALLPPGTPRSIYRTTRGHTPADAARNRFAGPLKERLVTLGEETRRRAGTSGRHSLASVAAEAGLDLLQIADHLGHRNVESTTHYIASSQSRAAATQMAKNLGTRHHTRKSIR